MTKKLPSIKDLFPHRVALKHKGDAQGVALRVMRHLEGQNVLINRDFHLNLLDDPERLVLRFRSKRPARAFKEVKKTVRDEDQG